MVDWENDSFMAEWDKTYVATNLKPGVKPYDRDLFLQLGQELAGVDETMQNCSFAIIAAVCCALGRADVVGRLFDDLTKNSRPEESQKVFLQFREAVITVLPYLGLPTCIPACYGLIGVVKRKGPQYAAPTRLRNPAIEAQDAIRGTELRKRIYTGVGNGEIFGLMDQYFADFTFFSSVVTWGWLIAPVSDQVFGLQSTHLIAASAIMALGAARQTRSHLKATIGIGNSPYLVKVVVGVVGRLAEWADRPVPSFDIDALANEMQAALKH
ncbi:hypothetical protein FDECE_10487 [Fusarium decemcellulare]|nr:hypothetical protein FDECE_10487 [Fusarium decemcellulare]